MMTCCCSDGFLPLGEAGLFVLVNSEAFPINSEAAQ